jgi:hypothetical protein
MSDLQTQPTVFTEEESAALSILSAEYSQQGQNHGHCYRTLSNASDQASDTTKILVRAPIRLGGYAF